MKRKPNLLVILFLVFSIYILTVHDNINVVTNFFSQSNWIDKPAKITGYTIDSLSYNDAKTHWDVGIEYTYTVSKDKINGTATIHENIIEGAGTDSTMVRQKIEKEYPLNSTVIVSINPNNNNIHTIKAFRYKRVLWASIGCVSIVLLFLYYALAGRKV